VVRVIQQARRDLGLDVSDRIALVVGADEPTAAAVRAHADFIASETLATSLTVVGAAEVAAEPQPAGDGGEVRVRLSAALRATDG
jgi:isoleucyl-tRNA synthetase